MAECGRYAIVAFVRNNNVLLLRRAQPGFGQGCYSLVGGKVEKNELSRLAALRETKEEVGITLEPQDCNLAHVMHFTTTTADIIALFFIAQSWIGEPVNKEPHKHDDMAWFPLNNLPENLLPRHRLALESIDKGLLYSELSC
jgi:8-oxo-dGTP diphosphatase